MKQPERQGSMPEASGIYNEPERAHLGTDEIGAAFDGLSRDDKLKLHAIEAHLLGGTGLGSGELLRDAVYRALEGERKCPRDVPFMAFLVMTMKSIAWHARRRSHRTVVMTDPPETPDASEADSSLSPSPEDELISSSVLQEIHAHFQDDEEAVLVLMGWTDGLRGKDLREATGLDQRSLDYAIKRIRTRMRRLYPNGWMP